MATRTVFTVAIIATLLLSACSSNYLMDQPRTFAACASFGENPRQESFTILYGVVASREGWAIESVDKKNLIIKARVMRDQGWTPLLLTINQSAEVVVTRDPDSPREMSVRWARNVQKWLNILEGAYTSRRCR